MWFIIGNLALLANIYLHYALDLWATAPPRRRGDRMKRRAFITLLGGAGKQRRRDVKAERACSVEVDH